jgi:nicotinate-nucleotide adenylyltransferase
MADEERGAAVGPPPERVGIFGGTFDPIHVGHLVAANEVHHRLGLDRMLLVVAGDPWQKRGEVIASAEARLAMVAAAVAEMPHLEACALEVERAGTTYTVDTVEHLAAPGRELFLVVGSDVAARLGTWHRVDDLARLVTLVVVTRDGEVGPEVPKFATTHVPVPRLDVSSTDLRARVAAGAPIDFLVPAPAVHVLHARRLYTPLR